MKTDILAQDNSDTAGASNSSNAGADNSSGASASILNSGNAGSLNDTSADNSKNAYALVESGNILLEINPELQKKISTEYILEQEVADVVAFCEKTGRTLYNQEAGTLIGYRKIGNMTYWAEYQKSDTDSPCDGSAFTRCRLINAYSHRMEIEIEMIWNGEKVEIYE